MIRSINPRVHRASNPDIPCTVDSSIMRFPSIRFSSPASSDGLFGSYGFRTDTFTAVVRGILPPLPLIAWAIYNVWTGTVSWGRNGKVTDDAYIVGGFVLIKLGIAAAIFTWEFLANFPRFDQIVGWLLLHRSRCVRLRSCCHYLRSTWLTTRNVLCNNEQPVEQVEVRLFGVVDFARSPCFFVDSLSGILAYPNPTTSASPAPAESIPTVIHRHRLLTDDFFDRRQLQSYEVLALR